MPEVRYYETQSEADSPAYFYGSPEQYWGGNETVLIERPAPLLGEHNKLILGDRLGYSKKDLEQLSQANII